MDESSDDEFVPELPPNADQIIFIEDIVSYMMLRNSPNYNLESDPVPFRDHVYNAFDQITQKAVRFLDNTLEMEHDDIFHRIRNSNSVNQFMYARFAEALSKKYFPEGFDASYFLIYCVNLSRMAAYFYNYGVLNAPDLAKENITEFLRRYDMTAGGWDTVHKAAERYEKMFRDSVNELSPESMNSDEIEPRNQAQDETSWDKSNSSISEEQIVSSENEENNQEREYSEDESYRNKSARSFSESSSEIDSSPLKESVLPPENIPQAFNFVENKRINTLELKDKFRPSTSKVDQESILIKEDCKRRMYLSWNEIRGGDSQTLGSDGNNSIHSSASDDRFCPGPSSVNNKSDLLSKSGCKRKLDISLNAKGNERSQTLCSEERLNDNYSSNDRFCKGTLNTDQKSSLKDCKRKRDLPSDEKSGANYASTNLGGNDLPFKFGPNEKYVSGAPNINQTSSLTNGSDFKRKLDLSSEEKSGANYESTNFGRNNLLFNFRPNKKCISGAPNTNQKSSLTNRIDCKRKLDLSFDENYASTNFGGNNLAFKSEPNQKCISRAPNTNQISSLTNRNDCKRKLDLSFDEKSGVNYASTNFGGNNLPFKSGPNEKCVSGAKNAEQMSVSSKIKLDFSLYKENNANAQNVPRANKKKSPILNDTSKPLKLQEYSPSSEDD